MRHTGLIGTTRAISGLYCLIRKVGVRMLLLLNYPVDLSSYVGRLLDVLVMFVLAGLLVLALSGAALVVWFSFFRGK